MNVTEWINKRKTLSESELTELFHRIQLEELPLIIYKQSNFNWVLCLDERLSGIPAKEGFIVKAGFYDSIQLMKWARKQFGSEKDINVQYLGPMIFSS